MSTVAIIPARYASTRFPGKPLARQTGRFLVQHVFDQIANTPAIDAVMVATDDPRIAEAVRSFGGEAVMTSPQHPSGTDRLAEVARGLDADVILNVQGDEPELPSQHVATLVDLMGSDLACEMATLACPFNRVSHANPDDHNAVKAWVSPEGLAVDFTRDMRPSPEGWAPSDPHPLLHLGIYAYRRQFLLDFASWPPSPLEQARRLEQMRALEAGHAIAVGLVDHAAVGIDTPEDYAAFVRRWNERTGGIAI